jgi:hypothetical protein
MIMYHLSRMNQIVGQVTHRINESHPMIMYHLSRMNQVQ